MHKRRLNELTLNFTIEPDGPILIKSGEEAGADPTLPSMSFVRTQHPVSRERTVYLPGASLKGTIRSHSERIIRTVLGNERQFCCDTLSRNDNCSSYLRRKKITETDDQYAALCLACRIFGHMEHASHLFTRDAYPDNAISVLATRQNVAIDRLSGGVAVGPFDMEVATEGQFKTQLRLYNFECWQVGLLALALRDLKTGQVRLGFAKSRGLGAVRVTFDKLEVGYPMQFDSAKHPFGSALLGVSELAPDMRRAYDFRPAGDTVAYPTAQSLVDDSEAWGRPAVEFNGDAEIMDVLRASVGAWRDVVAALKGEAA